MAPAWRDFVSLAVFLAFGEWEFAASARNRRKPLFSACRHSGAVRRTEPGISSEEAQFFSLISRFRVRAMRAPERRCLKDPSPPPARPTRTPAIDAETR